MTNSRTLQNPLGGICICHLLAVICLIGSLFSRCLVLIFAGLLTIHSVSAGLDEVDEPGPSGSSLEGESGQRVRELGRPLYRTFTRRDEGIVNKILTGVQDPRGLMVFGGVNCVLEYDGQHWASIPIPNSAWIQALACDKSGTIYVGGTGEIGALVLDGGTYRYKSYTSLVPASEPHLGEIKGVAIHGDDVYFLSDKALLRWSGPHLSVIHLPYEVGNSWCFSSFSGRLFVHAKHQPYSEVVGDHLQPVLDDPVLRETAIIAPIDLAKET